MALQQHPLMAAMASAQTRSQRKRLWEEYAKDEDNFAGLTACAMALFLQRMRRLLLMASFCASEVTPLGLGMSRGRARSNMRHRRRKPRASGLEDDEEKAEARSAKARQTLANIKSKASSKKDGAQVADVDLDVDFEGEIAENVTSRIGAGAFGQVYRVQSCKAWSPPSLNEPHNLQHRLMQ